MGTSGNSQDAMNATVVARAMYIKVISLTGSNGCELASAADAAIISPETETY